MKFVQGDAESLPFEDEVFDVYTIAFGLRNVTDIDKALSEAKASTHDEYSCLRRNKA